MSGGQGNLSLEPLAGASGPGSKASTVAYDDVPLSAFHWRVAVASFGGVYSDGFGLGIVGLVLSLAAPDLHLQAAYIGLLGGGALAGLFLGALAGGVIVDRFGRRPVFAFNMPMLCVLSAIQFFVATGSELLCLRLAIGFLLGTDYVVSKTLLTEFTPRQFRGRLMSTLSVAWAGGYASAYFVGYGLALANTESWRWMLAVSAVPCLLMIPLRWALPESPLWLAGMGRVAEATGIVRRYLGENVEVPCRNPSRLTAGTSWTRLVSPRWRRNTFVACAFFTCQVIPYFAVGTFVSRIIGELQVRDAFFGGVLYNVSLLLGAVAGLLVVDRMRRRTFLIGSFAASGAAMLALTVADGIGTIATIALFAIFAGVLSAASNLVYVYLPELFPTDMRGSGIGLAIATSRIGSAVSTFLLPGVVSQWGVHVALACCSGVLLFGCVVCYGLAPETKGMRLDAVVT